MVTENEIANFTVSTNEGSNILKPATFREDQVTIRSKMPKWLVKDPYVKDKWNFKMRCFKIYKYVNEAELHNLEELEKWSWTKFNSRVFNLATNIFIELNKVYKNGISSIFRWKISTMVALSFPELEVIYEKFRQVATEEAIQGVKKTTLKPETFAVI